MYSSWPARCAPRDGPPAVPARRCLEAPRPARAEAAARPRPARLCRLAARHGGRAHNRPRKRRTGSRCDERAEQSERVPAGASQARSREEATGCSDENHPPDDDRDLAVDDQASRRRRAPDRGPARRPGSKCQPRRGQRAPANDAPQPGGPETSGAVRVVTPRAVGTWPDAGEQARRRRGRPQPGPRVGKSPGHRRSRIRSGRSTPTSPQIGPIRVLERSAVAQEGSRG
jgi:hypothetical protein